ncbi:MAG: hypothetical protein U1E73_07830 [Planctomycetota bacterium]
MQRALVMGAIAALTTHGIAQDFVGFFLNNQVGATSRGGISSGAGEVMTRIDGHEYAGWGTDVAGMRTISSIFMIIQDQDAVATAETFDIVLYPEDPANPHFPDINAPITFATGIAGPPAPATGVISAASRIVTPATPVAVPIQGNGDIFVAFALPANAGWAVNPPTDGLSAQMVLGYQPSTTFTIFDIPGRAQQPSTPGSAANSHGLYRLSGSQSVTYSVCRNWVLDVEHSGVGGCVTGITNQASLLGSANPPPAGFGPCPGTADFESGVAPDVSQFDPARADNVAFDYYRTNSGSPLVFFLYDFAGTFGTELPISGVTPGSGVICVNLATFISAGFRIGSANEAFLVTSFPASSRAALAGFRLIQQAAEFEVATGFVYTSPCGRQSF